VVIEDLRFGFLGIISSRHSFDFKILGGISSGYREEKEISMV
jgi:hypothetical protein